MAMEKLNNELDIDKERKMMQKMQKREKEIRVLTDNEAQAISKQILKKHERESEVNAF